MINDVFSDTLYFQNNILEPVQTGPKRKVERSLVKRSVLKYENTKYFTRTL